MKIKAAVAVLALVTIVPLAPTAYAQAKPKVAATAKAPKMSAEAILNKYVQVSGGAAYSKIKTTVMEGTMTLPAQNISGKMVTYAKAPNHFYMSQELPGIGKTEVGFDGKTAWSRDPFQGTRTLSGPESEQLKAQAAFNREARWRDLYKKVEYLGIRKVDGKDAHAIRMTPKAGKPAVQFFDTSTFLLVRVDAVVESPQGRIPTESYLSDYQTVDGIKIPFTMRQRMAAIEMIIKFEQVKNNVPVDEKLFRKPAAAAGASAATETKGAPAPNER